MTRAQRRDVQRALRGARRLMAAAWDPFDRAAYSRGLAIIGRVRRAQQRSIWACGFLRLETRAEALARCASARRALLETRDPVRRAACRRAWDDAMGTVRTWAVPRDGTFYGWPRDLAGAA